MVVYQYLSARVFIRKKKTFAPMMRRCTVRSIIAGDDNLLFYPSPRQEIKSDNRHLLSSALESSNE